MATTGLHPLICLVAHITFQQGLQDAAMQFFSVALLQNLGQRETKPEFPFAYVLSVASTRGTGMEVGENARILPTSPHPRHQQML